MSRRLPIVVLAAVLLATPRFAAKKALFDNFHAETAGNARDWQIDTDQPVPLPAQSGITAGTPGTYWTGAISSWAVALVQRGYTVETNTAALTYGNSGNPRDLANYDVLIVDEPNTLFSAAEASAIFSFVQNGGGLVAISDHAGSDRNNDGQDSPKIWNAMDPSHLLGVSFASTGNANNSISQTSTNVRAVSTDSITRGPVGNVTGFAFHSGTTMTLYPAVNASVRGEVWMNGLAETSTTGLMCASAVYGNGRVVFAGDSSPADDGTAAPGNSNIFDGWGEAGATDSTLFLNATLWVTRRDAGDLTPPTVAVTSPNGGETWKAGSTHAITWSASDNIGVTAVDLAYSTDGGTSYPNTIATGLANSGTYAWAVPNAPGSAVRVRATARDAAGNSAQDGSNASFTIDRWTITASAGANGVIAPSGAVAVVEGANQAFTIAPNSGFSVASVVVDGASVGAVTSYTFTNVAARPHDLGDVLGRLDRAVPDGLGRLPRELRGRRELGERLHERHRRDALGSGRGRRHRHDPERFEDHDQHRHVRHRHHGWRAEGREPEPRGHDLPAGDGHDGRAPTPSTCCSTSPGSTRARWASRGRPSSTRRATARARCASTRAPTARRSPS